MYPCRTRGREYASLAVRADIREAPDRIPKQIRACLHKDRDSMMAHSYGQISYGREVLVARAETVCALKENDCGR